MVNNPYNHRSKAHPFDKIEDRVVLTVAVIVAFMVTVKDATTRAGAAVPKKS